MSQVWSAVNILQITTLLGFIGAKLPACLTDLLIQIYKIVTFELIPEDYYQPVAEAILPMPSDIAFSAQFIVFEEELGYIIYAMFLPFFGILYFTLFYLANYILFKITKKKKYYAKYQKIYGFYVRTFVELSLELTFLGLVELVMR